MTRLRTKTWLLAATVVAVVAFVAIRVATFPSARLYQGKTIREWVPLLDPQVGQEKKREEAAWAIMQTGTNAVSELERILAWRRNRLVETAQGYAIRFGFTTPPPIHPLELQSRACEAAYNLAERANVDISRLIPHLRYHFTNGTYADSNSSRALAHAGPAGIAVLTNLLFTGTRNVRDQAGWALHHVKSKPEVIAALIRSASTETDQQIRANFLLYLEGSRGPAEQLVPLGLKFIRSDDGYTRWAAASMLRDYVSIAEVRSALEQALTDSDSRVRSAAERALQEPPRKPSR